jgi:hypothetical protein
VVGCGRRAGLIKESFPQRWAGSARHKELRAAAIMETLCWQVNKMVVDLNLGALRVIGLVV